jgi:hypothetical protein
MQRQDRLAQSKWEQTCWHFSNRRFGCRADAHAALERELKGKPRWLEVTSSIIAHAQYGERGVHAKMPARAAPSGSSSSP